MAIIKILQTINGGEDVAKKGKREPEGGGERERERERERHGKPSSDGAKVFY